MDRDAVKGQENMGFLLRIIPITLALSLIFLAVEMLRGGAIAGLTDNTIGSLAGSLVGAAGIFLGSSLEKLSTWWDKRSDISERSQKVCELVAAELVNVAAGLMGTHRYFQAFVSSGNSAPTVDLLALQPRELSLTNALVTELLVLNERQIDVLSTLLGNLAITRRNFRELMDQGASFSPSDALKLKRMVAADMQILAKAFERFAPTRKLEFHGQPPKLAAVLLLEESGC